jgi:micrococcal nuclease
MYEYLCTLDTKKYEFGAVDGDTVDVIVDLGFRTFQKIRIRLLRVDTPERGEEDFKKATQVLKGLLKTAIATDGRLYVRTHKRASKQRGKYGRWLGEFTNLDRTLNINKELEEKWPYG